MLYQEQLLEVAKQIAGFSLVEADNLRKAVGKKLPKKMAEYKEKFLEKTTENGYSQEMADELWRLIEAGASYSFNKCISGKTYITDVHGDNYTIEELKDMKGVVLRSIDNNGNMINNKLIEVINTGIKKVYEFEFDNNTKVACTMDHKFLCNDNKYHTMQNIIKNNLEVKNVQNSMEQKND